MVYSRMQGPSRYEGFNPDIAPQLLVDQKESTL
jgi:hypothetical protein